MLLIENKILHLIVYILKVFYRRRRVFETKQRIFELNNFGKHQIKQRIADINVLEQGLSTKSSNFEERNKRSWDERVEGARRHTKRAHSQQPCCNTKNRKI